MLVQVFSNIDGRLIRSLRTLINQPGALTLAYVQGRRKPYLGPIQLFLVANVLFFAMQSMTQTDIAGAPLDSHLHRQDWSAFAQALVAQRLEAGLTTLDKYTPVFDQAVGLNAKSLIVLMVLPLAMCLPVAFYRERRPFVAHAVFSLHFYAFLLLLFCFSLAVAGMDALFGGEGLNSSRMDNVLSVLNLSVAALYLYVAIGTFYGARGIGRLLKALVLAIAVAAILLGYRFAIFLITLYST